MTRITTPRPPHSLVITYRRGEVGMTQEQLASALRDSTGLDAWTRRKVQRIEAGDQDPTLRDAIDLSQVLGVSLDTLSGGYATRSGWNGDSPSDRVLVLQ